MEVESYPNRIKICQELNRKLITRPGSLELIEKGVLEIDPNLKEILRNGEIMFRRVSSDETDTSGSSPSHKILKHQEALDDETARRLSLAAQQQRQILINDERQKLLQISENEIQPVKSLDKAKPPPSCKDNCKSLITGQVSRFKGLVFHNYTPAGGANENHDARIQQQEKFIQLQDTAGNQKPKKCLLKQNSTDQPSYNVSNTFITNNPIVTIINQNNKCSRCLNLPDRVLSLADLTVTQLKTECRLRNLSRSGNKQSLIATLAEFEREILANENACSHVIRQQKQMQLQQKQNCNNIRYSNNSNVSNNNSNTNINNTNQPPSTNVTSNTLHRPQLNDRSISLPTEYYDNSHQEHPNNLIAPVTLNFTCIGGSFSNLPLTPYSIFIGGESNTSCSNPSTSTNTTNNNNPYLYSSSSDNNLPLSLSTSASVSATITPQLSTASSNNTTSSPAQSSKRQSSTTVHNLSQDLPEPLPQPQSTNVLDSSPTNYSQPTNDINSTNATGPPPPPPPVSSSTSAVVVNPLLFYKLPTPSDQEPAFIQTNGLEMIQLVQMELLRNIEIQSQLPLREYANTNNSISLQHQREVLLNFLSQLIQKTPAFMTCTPLLADQHKINNWLMDQYKCTSIDLMNLSNAMNSNNCYQPVSTNQSYLTYLNQSQQPILTEQNVAPSELVADIPCDQPHLQNQTQSSVCNAGDNDLLNLINEVVYEDQMQQTNQNMEISYNDMIEKDHVHNHRQLSVLTNQNNDRPPNSPMIVDSSQPTSATIASPFQSNQYNKSSASNGDQKRAAWLQKVSPRLLYKSDNSNNILPSQSQQSFSIFNFDLPPSSTFYGSNTNSSSEGGASINSSITDAQILSPDTERVLFQTIFQHTNSGSSTDNEQLFAGFSTSITAPSHPSQLVNNNNNNSNSNDPHTCCLSISNNNRTGNSDSNNIDVDNYNPPTSQDEIDAFNKDDNITHS